MTDEKLLLLTNEYPPHIYGGAGVHVEYLSRALSQLMPVEVCCFGDQEVRASSKSYGNQRISVKGFDWEGAMGAPEQLRSPLRAARIAVDQMMAGLDATLIHCHTWYTHLAGVMGKLLYGVPLVVTVHSLEPLRPWKREQIGHGYDFSCWVERQALEMADAVIAVSEGTKQDLMQLLGIADQKIHVIHNGIDLREYHPKADHELSLELQERYGIDPQHPYLLFVGRITRQKGLPHLLEALHHVDPKCQVVLCAGAPDTAEIAAEVRQGVAALEQKRSGLFWIEEMLPRSEVIKLYNGAALFVCPSIYEPFGLINIEAMACGTPVVASAVGGIPEIILDGQTGVLVSFVAKESPGVASPVCSEGVRHKGKTAENMKIMGAEPADPAQFGQDLARAINDLLAHPQKGVEMGEAGRKRVEELFSWEKIAQQTYQLYRSLRVG